MKFEERKLKAEKWVVEYDGKLYGGDIIKAYQKLQRAKKAKRKKIREQNRKQKNNLEFCEEQDDTFYYIAGYTSGGAPYGVTWEEMGIQSDAGEFDD